MKQQICAILALIALISFANLQQVDSKKKNDNRNNLFDPIYAFDDLDAHTVSIQDHSTPSVASSPTTPNKPILRQPILQRPTATITNTDNNDNNQRQPVLSRFQTPMVSRQTLAPNLSNNLAATLSPLIVVQSSNRDSISVAKKETSGDQPKHWSALENYYQKLRQQASAQPKQPVIYQQVSPTYQVLQQPEVDDSLTAYKPLLNQYSPYSINSNNNNNNNGAKSPSAFLLPIMTSSSGSSGSSGSSSSFSSPSVDPDFGFTVHRQAAPGISRTGGIGSGSIILSTKQPSSGANQFGNQLDSIRPLIINYGGSTNQNNQPGGGGGSTINSQVESIPISSGPDGKIKYLEWRKLPELLLIQQQQQRVKHQQETFGSWYDHQRSKELLQEEAFCGPRNYLNLHVTPANQQQTQRDSGAKIQYARINQQSSVYDDDGSGTSNQVDVPVTLTAGEYPSHVGVYNGSEPNDDNYLCAATLIHEQYALTLASCVKSSVKSAELQPTQKGGGALSVRIGEWNLNKNKTGNDENNQQRIMLIREVEQVFLFPRYRNDSTEHNLALLRLTKPIDYLEMPYICPACQIQSRTSIKTSSCWTPVRNVTLEDYFDPHGEGETKERKIVSMLELPVRLFANDDNDCYRQTRVEFFNFQHPNYICSGDYRSTSPWRARLNQTDYFGSGIYCNEGGNLSLVSILHPIHSNSSSTYGYMDLSYYKPWMRNVISGRSF